MKARVAIFQLADRVYGRAATDLAAHARARRVPATVERIDALLCIENLHVHVRMAFAVWFAPVGVGRERIAASEEITVQGDGRSIEVVLRAAPVALPRAGRYQFELLANGKRVKAQAVMFGGGRG